MPDSSAENGSHRVLELGHGKKRSAIKSPYQLFFKKRTGCLIDKRKRTYPVKTNDIVVSLLGVMLDGETTRIPTRVGELFAKGNGGEANENWSLLPHFSVKTCL